MKRILSIILIACLAFSCVALTSCSDNDEIGVDTDTAVVSTGGNLEIVSLDCGKADAFVLFTDNHTIIIDCGESDDGKKITKLLSSRGIDTIDYMILSHYDKDHIGGVEKVIKKVTVNKIYETFIPKLENEVYDSFVTAVTNSGIDTVKVTSKEILEVDGIVFTIYPPENSSYSIDESNNSSLCVTIQNGENSFLFAGDAQDARLAELIADNLGSFDFLKCPYHGHFQTNLPAFIEMVQPKYTVITCSEKNPVDQMTLDEFAKYSTEVYQMQNGDVTIKSDSKNITCVQQNVDDSVTQ